MRPSRSPARALLLCALAFCVIASTSVASDPGTESSFEPALRDLWSRGSTRFHRQWLATRPVDAALASTIDPATLVPAPGAQLIANIPDLQWRDIVAFSDVLDVSVTPSREPEPGEAPVDRFVFAAASLHSDRDGPADLSIGSERGYVAWLNGKQIHSRASDQPFAPDSQRIPVELRRGNNQLVLRLHETRPGHSRIALRVIEPGTALPRIEEITPSIDSDKGHVLTIRTHTSVEPDRAPVALDIIGADGSVISNKSANRGVVAEFDTSSWRDGPYEIRASTTDRWQQPQVTYIPWYKGDVRDGLRQLIDAAAAAKDDVPGNHVKMLAALAKDRLGSIENATPSSWPLVHAALMEFEELQQEARGRAARVRSGGFVRIAYKDEIDGSTQYCRAYLPAAYSTHKAWPLIVYLHGYNPANPDYINWWSVEQRHHRIAESRGTIWIDAHGRGNAQYAGIGDRDVMKCMEEAKRRFAVDPDRVYLTGESMGGHGTWRIASRHPDVFAAAAPVYGGWDFRITNVAGPSQTPSPQSALAAYSLEYASSFANAESLLHVPLLVIHGDADAAVSVENSRHAVRLLQRWGYDIRYHEMPGWGHEDLRQQAFIADWLLSHRRKQEPRIVRLRSVDLNAASAYWLKVAAFQRPAEITRITAEVQEPGVVKVDSTNVAAFTLDLPQALRGSSQKLRVIWNGETHEFAGTGVTEVGTRSTPATLAKRAGLEGPLPAVLETPFAVVIGTISTDSRMREMIQAGADSLAHQWRSWQRQPLRIIKDTELTAEHERTLSLILLGAADANAVTKRLARKLPFSASRNGIAVDGRQWKIRDSVLQAVYPSPLAADRYIYLVLPTSPEGMYFWRPQLVHFERGNALTTFDWLIQDGRRPPPGTMDPNAAHVASGVFDASWRRQDRWTQFRDEKAETWSLRRAPPQGFAPSSAALQAAAGRYELQPGTVVSIRVDGNELIVDLPPQWSQPPLKMRPESDAVYIISSTSDTAEFVRDSAGAISGVSVESNGSVIWAKRLP